MPSPVRAEPSQVGLARQPAGGRALGEQVEPVVERARQEVLGARAGEAVHAQLAEFGEDGRRIAVQATRNAFWAGGISLSS